MLVSNCYFTLICRAKASRAKRQENHFTPPYTPEPPDTSLAFGIQEEVLSNAAGCEQIPARDHEMPSGVTAIPNATAPAIYVEPSNINRRASEYHQKLGHKKNPATRAGIGLKQFCRLVTSPTTKEYIAPVVKGNQQFQDTIKALNNLIEGPGYLPGKLRLDIIHINRMKRSKKHDKMKVISEKWKTEGLSVKQVCRLSGMKESTIRGYLRVPGAHARAIKPEDRAFVLAFFRRPDISCQLPHKRYAKCRFMQGTLHSLYAKYTEAAKLKGKTVLSLSSVWRCLPRKEFRRVSQIPFMNCKCEKCENASLALQACTALGMKEIDKQLTPNAVAGCCKVQFEEGITPTLQSDQGGVTQMPDPIFLTDPGCRVRACDNCERKFKEKVIEANPDFDWTKPTSWHEWKLSQIAHPNGKDNKTKVNLRHQRLGTTEDLLNVVCHHVDVLADHLFMLRWQSQQFENCKATLQEGEVLAVMDFAKNEPIG